MRVGEKAVVQILGYALGMDKRESGKEREKEEERVFVLCPLIV